MFIWMKNLIFPPRCPVCGDIVSPRSSIVCFSCKDVPQQIREPRCKKCSKPILSEEAEFCWDCSEKEFHYVQGAALWVYDDTMRNSIAAFKYGGRKEYGTYYSQQLLRVYGNWMKKIAPDALIPVPLHKSREKRRGFNQAELLAGHLGKAMGVPVLGDVLVRDKKTKPQKELNDKERLKNLKQAFAVKAEKEGILDTLNKVILVDDIYTTGSTIEACTEVLKKAGVNNIYFLTLCIGKGF